MGKSKTDWIFSWDIFCPYLDKTFLKKSISEYPKKHFWALRNILCFRDLAKSINEFFVGLSKCIAFIYVYFTNGIDKTS
jgi:hypothetical protein